MIFCYENIKFRAERTLQWRHRVFMAAISYAQYHSHLLISNTPIGEPRSIVVTATAWRTCINATSHHLQFYVVYQTRNYILIFVLDFWYIPSDNWSLLYMFFTNKNIFRCSFITCQKCRASSHKSFEYLTETSCPESLIPVNLASFARGHLQKCMHLESSSILASGRKSTSITCAKNFNGTQTLRKCALEESFDSLWKNCMAFPFKW